MLIKRIYRTLGRIPLEVWRWKHNQFDSIVFIHINKTGGSSVASSLSLPHEHKTALEKIAELGESRWNSKYTFTIVRNPWDKVVSHYHYRVKTNKTGLNDKPIGFRQWVELSYRNKDPAYYDNPKMFMPQIDWISDAEGQILVDKVCFFETLEKDFNNLCYQLGVTAPLPHLKASNRSHYRDYYDKRTAKIVAQWFAADLEIFGYTFS